MTFFDASFVNQLANELNDLLMNDEDVKSIIDTFDNLPKLKTHNCQQLVQIIRSFKFPDTFTRDRQGDFNYTFVNNLISEMRNLLMSSTQTLTLNEVFNKITQQQCPNFYKLIQVFIPQRAITRAEVLEKYRKLSAAESSKLARLVFYNPKSSTSTVDVKFNDPVVLFNYLVGQGKSETEIDGYLSFSKMIVGF